MKPPSGVFENLGPKQQPPADESVQTHNERLQRGYKKFLADPRNRSTPGATADFLRKLSHNELLSPASTHYLLELMTAQTVPRRLRNGIPENVRLADKCGTSYTLQLTGQRGIEGSEVTAAYNDIGVLTWADGHRVIVAAFLSKSPAPKAERDAIFAELARITVATLHP